jgi:biotin carboxyl carrier protein
MKIKVKNKTYEVEISEVGEEIVKITVDGKEFLFGERGKEEEKISLTRTSLPKRNFSIKEIKAPISGVVSDIFVKEGEIIKKGRKILTISAMKMENEIVSEFGGKIKEILIKKTQETKEGDILVVLQ